MSLSRERWEIRGSVQGVGFRPAFHRLAVNLGLAGWVSNTSFGVLAEVESERATLEKFLTETKSLSQPIRVESVERAALPVLGERSFRIVETSIQGQLTADTPADLATCASCVRELFDPSNRRFRYPWISCAECGPRYSLIESLPYDRGRTTMRDFTMCEQCQAEFENPTDRRFHSQTNCCASCGPGVELHDQEGAVLARGDRSIRLAAEEIRRGKIVALKGVGGFQLITSALSHEAVESLRLRKNRPEKPFAVMLSGISEIESECDLSEKEKTLLTSAIAPIVLLKRKAGGNLTESVAPENPFLGVMLPYSPIHHLLMTEVGIPLVVTSGNSSNDPIFSEEKEALEGLRSIADLFLIHNRRIASSVDDSVMQLMRGKPQVLRRARGFATGVVDLKRGLPRIVAVGGHLKNTVAVTAGSKILLSPHIGDLGNERARRLHEATLSGFRQTYAGRETKTVSDLHPDLSTSSRQMLLVQHHHAHALSCMVEHSLPGPVFAVCWDGSGYGTDGTLWGGEFLRVNSSGFDRVGKLRSFALPGGEAAMREPRRSAFGILYEAGLLNEADFGFEPTERSILQSMLKKKINSPRTSSMGRLFDAVCAIVDPKCPKKLSFEGQAAMRLEHACEAALESRHSDSGYSLEMLPEYVIDWSPLLQGIFRDLSLQFPVGRIALKFHRALADVILAMARELGEKQIVLTGGCFQNRVLTRMASECLEKNGFEVYWHQSVPPNDGGLAVGQVAAALHEVNS